MQAFGSTDAGASFYIEHKRRKIFHAGDLNNWHWNEEVAKDEACIYENQYICELELLSEQVAADYKKTIEITERLAELETEMEQKLNQWTEATEELENCQ